MINDKVNTCGLNLFDPELLQMFVLLSFRILSLIQSILKATLANAALPLFSQFHGSRKKRRPSRQNVDEIFPCNRVKGGMLYNCGSLITNSDPPGG